MVFPARRTSRRSPALTPAFGADVQCEDRRVYVDDEPFDFDSRVLLDLLAERGSHLVYCRGQTSAR